MVKREIFDPRVAAIRALQDSHYDTLERGIALTLETQRREFDDAHAKYEIALEERRVRVVEEQKTANHLNALGGQIAVFGTASVGLAAEPAKPPELPEGTLVFFFGSSFRFRFASSTVLTF